jgi:type I restriction enzyme S subunit
MTQTTKYLNVPLLRFPEFAKDGEWEKEVLGQLGNFLGGGTPERSNSDYWVGNIPWISSSDLVEDNIHLISITRFINENAIKQSATKIIPKGSVLFVSRVGVGKLAVNKTDLCTSQDFTNFVPTKVSSYFISYYFIANKKQLIALNQGTSIKGFSKSDLENFELVYPKNSLEQQKIADCLSSLDDVIAAHNQKLALLKTHKKGLMQQLFPATGSTVPLLRFSGFAKDGDWMATTLGNAANFINGKAYKQDELLETGKYRVLRVGNFFSNNHWYFSNLELEENKYCDTGDLLYAWSASFGPKIWNQEKVIYHYHIWKVEEKKDLDRKFLFLLLDYLTSKIKEQQANGFGLLHITKGTIEAWECRIPKNKKEQEKISNLLFSIQNLIDSQSQKIDALKAHKKGLMQQLFPVTND